MYTNAPTALSLPGRFYYDGLKKRGLATIEARKTPYPLNVSFSMHAHTRAITADISSTSSMVVYPSRA